MPETPGDATENTFAAQLKSLLHTTRHDDGSPYTPREVAEEMTQLGYRISKTHMYALLSGERQPSHALVQGFIRYFKVSADYFSDTEAGCVLRAEYALLGLLADSGVREIAYRASQLPPGKLPSILEFIKFQESQLGQTGESEDHFSG